MVYARPNKALQPTFDPSRMAAIAAGNAVSNAAELKRTKVRRLIMSVVGYSFCLERVSKADLIASAPFR